ncbi:DUF7344 domain-containing protein [Natronorubrum sp. FCH18a]|uniref:DUF7344 domain-containing protein n=1 Tax=Natronorubrum sp. FCH18a TaxID=3447018 RepID=UPI003F518704
MSNDDCHCRCKEKRFLNNIAFDGGRSFDEILTALSDIRRRYILYYLQDENQASLTAIAQQIAAWEHKCSVDDISEETTATYKIRLYHNHLPKLREAKIVEYDARSKMVVFRGAPDLVEMCLDHCASQDLPD